MDTPRKWTHLDNRNFKKIETHVLLVRKKVLIPAHLLNKFTSVYNTFPWRYEFSCINVKSWRQMRRRFEVGLSVRISVWKYARILPMLTHRHVTKNEKGTRIWFASPVLRVQMIRFSFKFPTIANCFLYNCVMRFAKRWERPSPSRSSFLEEMGTYHTNDICFSLIFSWMHQLLISSDFEPI